MSNWGKNKVNSSDINKGNEFTNNDVLSVEELNAMVNNSFYSVDFVENMTETPDVSSANIVGTPKVELIDYIKDGKTFKKFKFSNLKGTAGETGDNVELRISNGFIQWKPTKSQTWNNLIELSELTGTALETKVSKSGDTMTGALRVNSEDVQFDEEQEPIVYSTDPSGFSSTEQYTTINIEGLKANASKTIVSGRIYYSDFNVDEGFYGSLPLTISAYVGPPVATTFTCEIKEVTEDNKLIVGWTEDSGNEVFGTLLSLDISITQITPTGVADVSTKVLGADRVVVNKVPSTDKEATNKEYVDKLNKDNLTLFGSHKIYGEKDFAYGALLSQGVRVFDADNTLNKSFLKNADLIYDTATSTAGTYNFLKDISNYRFILFIGYISSSGVQSYKYMTVPVENFKITKDNVKIRLDCSTATETRYLSIYYVDDTSFNLSTSSMNLRKIYGIY